MRMKRYAVYCWLVLSTPAYAGPLAERLGINLKKPAKESKLGKFFKKGAQSALKYIPGGEAVSDLLGIGGDLEKKVERIEEKQATSLDQLQALSRKALETKKKCRGAVLLQKTVPAKGRGAGWWPEAEQAQEAIRRAIRRYFGLSYQPR